MPNDLTPLPSRAPAPYTEASYIAVATPRKRAMRTFLPWQLFRFLVINLKMLQMIAKSHD